MINVRAVWQTKRRRRRRQRRGYSLVHVGSAVCSRSTRGGCGRQYLAPCRSGWVSIDSTDRRPHCTSIPTSITSYEPIIYSYKHPSATQWQHRSTIRQWQLSAAISQVNPTLVAQRKQWKTNRDSFCRLRPEWSGLFASSGGSQQQKPSLRELRARPAGASPARRFNSTNCIVMSSSLYIVSHEI